MHEPVVEIDGFTCEAYAHDGISHPVYRAGEGPCIIVIHESPNLHPGVVDFARRVVARGHSVWMPSLFGTPMRPFSLGAALRRLPHLCTARELTAFALDGPGPIAGWLRALAAEAHRRCGGPGVGAVGMCFTGGFALAMAVDDRMLAPVLSQPSTPFPVSKRRRANAGVGDDDLRRIATRTQEGLCVLGLRFSHDPLVPAARFETLRSALGDAFLAVEIDSGPGNASGHGRRSHSVLTLDLVDEPGQPTHDALRRVLDFLDERLSG